jgi:hypothetical protein
VAIIARKKFFSVSAIKDVHDTLGASLGRAIPIQEDVIGVRKRCGESVERDRLSMNELRAVAICLACQVPIPKRVSCGCGIELVNERGCEDPFFGIESFRPSKICSIGYPLPPKHFIYRELYAGETKFEEEAKRGICLQVKAA